MLSSVPGYPISGNQQVELAGTGRFDELAAQIETLAASEPLRTPEQHALCFAYSKLKHYARLFACLDRLEYQAAQGDRRTRLFGLDDVTPAIHIMRAEALIDFGRYAEAGESARLALSWFRRERSDDKDIEANALAALTLASTFGGDRRAAEGYVAELEKVDVSWPRYNAYANAKAYALARGSLALGRFDKTLQALAENRAFAVQVLLDNLLSGATFRGTSNWVWQELPRGYMVAKSLKELGRIGEAKASYDQLLKTRQVESNGEIYWLILYDRGRIAESENNTAEAIGFYARAIEVLEGQRASINTEVNKIGFIGNKQEVYERIVRLLFRSGQTGGALEYVERSKSRALVDMLAARLVAPEFVRPAADTASALGAYLKADAAAKLQVPMQADGGEVRRRGLAQAAERLRQVSPEVASLVTVDKVSLDKMQKLLADNETLIQYYLPGDEGYAFVLTRSGLKAFPVSGNGLVAEVKQFRVAMEQRDKAAPDLLQRLYDRLIKPFAAELKTGNLLIVPHGPLHYVSFAALHDGNGYLVERFGLRSLPSASVLEYIRAQRTPSGAPMLVFGNPDLGSSEFDLPDAEEEAKTLARTMPKTKLLTRKAASETAFVEQAGDYPLIHIASHGEFKADAPLTSALLLAKDDKNDGLLTVAELYGLKLRADLVTLSACETGLGKVASGDDVVGLSRGFLFAGARSIIGSLWNVPDRATSYLMERMYLYLARGNKRDALRSAQLETKKRSPHPFFWAGFYLIGSER